MRLLVCGGRDYDDRARVFAALDWAHAHRPVSLVIHGAAHGADTLAGEWAKERGIPAEEYRADWKKLGPVAGPVRNDRMLREGKPDGVMAFPGGVGTMDMVRRAESSGVPVWKPYKWKDRT
jgi:hypothetical protein